MEDDVFELVWESGQIMMKDHSSRVPRIPTLHKGSSCDQAVTKLDNSEVSSFKAKVPLCSWPFLQVRTSGRSKGSGVSSISNRTSNRQDASHARGGYVVNDSTSMKMQRQSAKELNELLLADIESETVGDKKSAPDREGAVSKKRRAAAVQYISERKQRRRINEKMHVLQELIPGCNEIMSTGMGTSMGMLGMNDGSPKHPIFLVPPMQGIHIPFSASGSSTYRKLNCEDAVKNKNSKSTHNAEASNSRGGKMQFTPLFK